MLAAQILISRSAARLPGGIAAMAAAMTMKKYGLGLLIASGGVLFFLLALVLVVAANTFLHRDLVSEGSDESLRQDGRTVTRERCTG